MWEENEKGRLSSCNLLVANQSIKEKKMEREKKSLALLSGACWYVHVGAGTGSHKDECCFFNPSSLWQSMMHLLTCSFVVWKGFAVFCCHGTQVEASCIE